MPSDQVSAAEGRPCLVTLRLRSSRDLSQRYRYGARLLRPWARAGVSTLQSAMSSALARMRAGQIGADRRRIPWPLPAQSASETSPRTARGAPAHPPTTAPRRVDEALLATR